MSRDAGSEFHEMSTSKMATSFTDGGARAHAPRLAAGEGC